LPGKLPVQEPVIAGVGHCLECVAPAFAWPPRRPNHNLVRFGLDLDFFPKPTAFEQRLRDANAL
jgi:hypothetical protein